MTAPAARTIDTPVCIAALYRFAPLTDLADLRERLHARCREGGVRGTLLLAEEGINGTIAGEEAAIEAVLGAIRAIPGCENVAATLSQASSMPFRRLKVRVKREIVTMGQADIDPPDAAGTYVDPSDWNALVDDPDTLLIDTRNDYEVAIGSFRGAIDPRTKSFREFPPGSIRIGRPGRRAGGNRKSRCSAPAVSGAKRLRPI